MIEQLFALIQGARRRWRLRIALRGVAVVAITILATLLIASWWMDRFRFSLAAVAVAGAAVWITLLLVAWRVLARPLRRRLDDARVALYLEEHEPRLEGSLLAAVEHARAESPRVSRALSMRLVSDAVTRALAAPAWPRIERRGIAQASAVLALTALTAALLFIARPEFLANGARALIPVVGLSERPYTIAAFPGDTTIPRGADLTVTARLRGFEAQAVELLVRRSPSDGWERIGMTRADEAGEYAALLFNVRAPLTWAVEAAGVRSPERRLLVADLPWVENIRVRLDFPAWSRLAARETEGGDIAALAGTRATIAVRPTLPVERAALVIGADTVALAADAEGRMAGTFTVRAPGEYRIVFPQLDGRFGPGSPSYVVEVLEDLPPAVRLSKPGRDADATSIEEVFLEAQAEDDFGVSDLELTFRVNGGEERTVTLYDGGPRTDVVAGHMLFLEEMTLQPGDVISYHARVRDAHPGRSAVSSDIYFLTVRPFDRAFREAEDGGMPGQGGTNAGELSERQRQIVAGTFRQVRDGAGMTEAEQRDNLATLAMSQGRLREEVQELLRRLRTRYVAQQDSTMTPVIAALDTAIQAMTEAEQRLGSRAPSPALVPEQRALAMLQRAEAVFNREREVARGQRNGQGGGGGGNPSAEDLADLFELELDRMRNQYETVEQGRQNQQSQQADSLLERLRELARRQQQENNRSGQAAPGGSQSQNQRRMAAQADSIARQLERLSRQQQNSEALADAARRTREAANQMRGEGGPAGSGEAALDRLREAAREIEGGRRAASQRDVEQARQRAEQLQQEQRDVAEQVGRIPNENTPQRNEQVRRLVDRKNRMADEVESLESDLERMARQNQQAQPDAARRLRDAGRGLRDSRLEDKIRYSRGVMQGRSPEYARAFEESIAGDLDSLAARLGAAGGAFAETREERVARQLERTRDVANALETLSERARRQREQSGQQRGEQGQQGQGQQGQQDQGQQGQQGQGQQGQQGQGQQGQQGQGQQGQQGQGQQGQGGQRGGGAGNAEGRQLDRELDERIRELRDIRDALRRDGVETGGLNNALDAAEAAENFGPVGAPRGLEAIESRVVPGLREFEFEVRRQVLGAATAPSLTGETRVPESFRPEVERYYRSLSERAPEPQRRP